MLFFKKNSPMSIQANRLNGINRANNRLLHMQTKQMQQLQSLSSIAAALDKRLMNKLIGDASKFNQKLYSKKEQLQFAEEAWKRKNENQNIKKNLKDIQNSTETISSNKIVDRNNLPIPPYKNKEKENTNKHQEKQDTPSVDIKNFSPQELQKLVDVANNGSGKEKEEAISILKSMMESNKEAPKITSPMVKRSDTSEITKSIEADKQLAANMNPINNNLMEKIVKRLILEVYDEKEFEYQKFIDTIYNISAAHKTSPVLIPVLNKALRKS